jgi:hypothetical protein
MNPAPALWHARNTRCVADELARIAERTPASVAGATPGLQDRARLLALAARELADRCRHFQHAAEAELGPGYNDAT